MNPVGLRWFITQRSCKLREGLGPGVSAAELPSTGWGTPLLMYHNARLSIRCFTPSLPSLTTAHGQFNNPIQQHRLMY